MARVPIPPPAGLTNGDLIRWCFAGPRWKASAARAFGCSERQVWNLCHGVHPLTARHYFAMDAAIKRRKQVIPFATDRDHKRVDAKWARERDSADRFEATIRPTLARYAA